MSRDFLQTCFSVLTVY